MKYSFPNIQAVSGRCTILGLMLLWSVIFLSGACSREECLENKNALPQIGFYDSSLPDQKVTLDSTAIYARGVPGGGLVLDSLSKASSLTIPFNLESDTTCYIFKYIRRDLLRAGICDTLRIVYSRTPYFVSSACGVSYRLLINDLRSTHFLIDSVSAPQALITNVKRQNIHVYFRVDHSEPDQGNTDEDFGSGGDENSDENGEPENPENQI